ncbi:cytochrome P450 [Laetiporus sulphureus 93-53]|uniref:Cytochrome P450 n=1 Tax=Laetiporus sulphureus 93-53 TaxID=1314785 RepID=A0A165CZG0_9APHY|nr:cytochrome P450 [Laetiporus sulphureus 93-53]KZT03813.1 cytochrome P450 [Laetiporus sulphureus 93-53]
MIHPLGLFVFLTAWVPEPLAIKLALAVPSAAILLFFSALLTRTEDSGDVPVRLSVCPLFSIAPFFRRRFDFLKRGFEVTGESIYQFKLLTKTITVVSGPKARHDFFAAKELDLNAGFQALSATIPHIPGLASDLGKRRIALIHRRLAAAQSSERLEQLIPQILDDAWRIMDLWGRPRKIDPFVAIPQITFQTNLRSLTCAELADDALLGARLKQLYDTLDTATTPASVLFPCFPTPNAVRRVLASRAIYKIVGRAIDGRIKGESRGSDDTLQMLAECGDERIVMIGFIMGLLVAGARSTGATASWLVTFLAGHPEWLAKARTELLNLLLEHGAPLPSSSLPQFPSRPPTTSSTPLFTPAHSPSPCPPNASDLMSSHPPTNIASPCFLSASLASLPLSAWESHTPILDAAIRETLRLAQPHVALRQHTGAHDIHVGGRRVRPGEYVVYPLADAHLVEGTGSWEPGRWMRGGKGDGGMEWIGWGAGRTPCLGQRLARLQLKLVAALFVLGFERLRVEDGSGRMLEGAELPEPDWNDLLGCKPKGKACWLGCERSEDDSRC